MSSDFIIDYFYSFFFNKKICLGNLFRYNAGTDVDYGLFGHFFHRITSYVMGVKFIFSYFIYSSIVLVLRKLNVFFILLS